VYGVFAAEPAIFIHFKPVGGILFVFCRIVVSLLAFVTSESYLNSQCGTSIAFLLDLAEKGSLFNARKMNPSADR